MANHQLDHGDRDTSLVFRRWVGIPKGMPISVRLRQVDKKANFELISSNTGATAILASPKPAGRYLAEMLAAGIPARKTGLPIRRGDAAKDLKKPCNADLEANTWQEVKPTQRNSP